MELFQFNGWKKAPFIVKRISPAQKEEMRFHWASPKKIRKLLEFYELDTQDYNMEELHLVVNAGHAYVAWKEGVDNVKIERNSNT